MAPIPTANTVPTPGIARAAPDFNKLVAPVLATVPAAVPATLAPVLATVPATLAPALATVPAAAVPAFNVVPTGAAEALGGTIPTAFFAQFTIDEIRPGFLPTGVFVSGAVPGLFLSGKSGTSGTLKPDGFFVSGAVPGLFLSGISGMPGEDPGAPWIDGIFRPKIAASGPNSLVKPPIAVAIGAIPIIIRNIPLEKIPDNPPNRVWNNPFSSGFSSFAPNAANDGAAIFLLSNRDSSLSVDALSIFSNISS